MIEVIGVRFKQAGKIYYFDPIDLPIESESAVIVETARGVEYGKVVVGKKMVQENDVSRMIAWLAEWYPQGSIGTAVGTPTT